MTPTSVPLDQVDLADLDVFEQNQAWGMFDTLRREAPVHWNPEHDGGSGFWSVTRYDDIELDRQGLRDLHVDEVHQPRGAPRGVPGAAQVDPRDRRPAAPGAAQAAHARLHPGPAPSLRGLPARPGEGDRRHCPPAGGDGLRRRDRRGLPDRRARPAARHPRGDDPAADRVGQRDRRLLRPRVRPRPGQLRGGRGLPAPAVQLAGLRRRSSSTAASWQPSARVATATTWSASWSTGSPRTASRSRPSTTTTTSCCSSSPATRRPGRRSATR